MNSPISIRIDGPVATIVVDRPEARNAMTFAMYDMLVSLLAEVASQPAVRVLVLRGNEKAFIAGTDIGEFSAFTSGVDGRAYEETVEKVLTAIEACPVPTIAAIRGFAVGGGLAIAAACDMRMVANTARIGVPIAQTVGNCLSSRNLQRLVNVLGLGNVGRMLYAAELLDASVYSGCGFATWLVDDGRFEKALVSRLAAITAGAPLTLSATRQSLRRLSAGSLEDGDLIESIYGSADFAEGVSAFLAKRRPEWKGR